MRCQWMFIRCSWQISMGISIGISMGILWYFSWGEKSDIHGVGGFNGDQNRLSMGKIMLKKMDRNSYLQCGAP